ATFKARNSASVPELSATASRVPQYSASRASSRSISAPAPTKEPRRTTRSKIAASSGICSSAWAGRFTYGMSCRGTGLVLIKLGDGLHHVGELLRREVLVRRQRDHGVGVAIGHGEIAVT